MTGTSGQISELGRRAAQRRDWATLARCAQELMGRDPGDSEGHFLYGLAQKAAGRSAMAADCFAKALALDPSRYDAAIELASRYSVTDRQPEAYDLLQLYESQLTNSPRYLDLAGLTYSTIGLHERAWPLYRLANQLQPEVPRLMANLAACAVFVGRIDDAKSIYRKLLDRHPTHQRNHYNLAQLETATDSRHVDQMKGVLSAGSLPPERNIFLYYAIGKELEDLGRWDEAFEYYRRAGDAVTSVSQYDVSREFGLIDEIIESCGADWLAAEPAHRPIPADKTPVFVVGLPRSGTTLTERILSSHSSVESIGETLQLPAAIRRVSGVQTQDEMNAEIVRAAARAEVKFVRDGYLAAIRHRLGAKPMFIEKYPENVLYLGFIAKAWPEARIIHVHRNAMDACFAMYKQSYFRYAYTLENVGRYYLAFDRLLRHWRAVLGDRLVEVRYESLVTDQEGQTRQLLARLGLDFEPACLEFEKNETAAATASSVQVRERLHSRSVNRWRHFAKQLEPLRQMLERSGIAVNCEAT